MNTMSITVAGAGILGLWQALLLARAGHRVRLIDARSDPLSTNASSHAGAMLAPDCESEAAPAIVRELGREGLALWRAVFPGLHNRGTIIVAAPRDRSELVRFARLTSGHRSLNEGELARIEPELAGRFAEALFFPDEAHMTTPDAVAFLIDAVQAAGTVVEFGSAWTGASQGCDTVIDCRGMAARGELPTLRGVRGERILVRTHEVALQRPIRLLHPRHSIYVVPWSGGRYLIGATMIESEDAGPVTVRSGLELLGTTYALHPAFGEAEVLELGAGVRPAFPDNVPRVVIREGGRRILINGAFRHGFLLAPVLAKAVERYLAAGAPHPLVSMEQE